MKTEIHVNLLGNWVRLVDYDKIMDHPAYMWLDKNDIYNLKENFIMVKYQNQEHIIHKSHIQLRFVKEPSN